MVKVIGSLIIITSGIIAGRLMGYQYTQRTRELQRFLHALHQLETEISYGQTILPLALERLAQFSREPQKKFFQLFQKKIEPGQGLTADLAWLKSIEETSAKFCLKEEDWEVLKQFGQGLGNSDDQNQIRHLKVAQKRLEQLEFKARAESEKLNRMWNYIGVLTGIALVILLY